MNELKQKDNPLLYWFSKVGELFGLSIVWLLLCIPVVTFVPASIALYDSVAHCIRKEEEESISRFFRTLKKELLRGILLSLIWLALGAMLVYGYGILYQMGKENQTIAIYSLVYLCTMSIPLGVLSWMIPVESRFEHSFFGLFKASAVYAISHLPTTLILLVLFAAAVALVLLVFPVLAVLMPGITVTVQSWFVERVFKKYIPQEEDHDDDL